MSSAPGGAKFIESLTNAVKDLSLLYAHSPDDKARASLKAYVDKIEPELAEAVGAGPARVIMNAFAAAVLTEKRKIEAQGLSRA